LGRRAYLNRKKNKRLQKENALGEKGGKKTRGPRKELTLEKSEAVGQKKFFWGFLGFSVAGGEKPGPPQRGATHPLKLANRGRSGGKYFKLQGGEEKQQNGKRSRNIYI